MYSIFITALDLASLHGADDILDVGLADHVLVGGGGDDHDPELPALRKAVVHESMSSSGSLVFVVTFSIVVTIINVVIFSIVVIVKVLLTCTDWPME